MSRLDTIKRVGFPIEECPKCHADDAGNCDLCRGSGEFQQLLRKDWEPPAMRPGQELVAYLDVDHWSGIALMEDGEVIDELEFPFATAFATGKHFETLGFTVEQ